MSSLSRVIKFGTIFTRVRDLMRAGVMKEKDRPLWYDTMKAFPPVESPTLEREIPSDPITEILYHEDIIRAKFQKVYFSNYALDLNNHTAIRKSPCYRFILKYQQLEKSWIGTEEELFDATASALTQEGLQLKKRGEKGPAKVERSDKKEDAPVISKEDMATLLRTTVTNTKEQET